MSSQRSVGAGGLSSQDTIDSSRGTIARTSFQERAVLNGTPSDNNEALKRELAFDIGQLLLDLTGILDPTPISDGSNALISLARGRFWDAAISAVSIVPYIGDLAKLGKLPKYLASIRKAIALARRDAQWANALRPLLKKVKKLLDDLLELAADKLPDKASETLKSIRDEIGRFLNGSVGTVPSGKTASGSRKGSSPNANSGNTGASKKPATKKDSNSANKTNENKKKPKKNAPPAKKPVRRHDPCKTKGKDPTKDKNSVIDPDVNLDADIQKIQAGEFKKSGDDLVVNGRTYGLHSDTGRTYPKSGPGITNLDRGQHQFLKQLNSQSLENAMKFAENFPDLDKEKVQKVMKIWRKCK